MPKEIDQIKKVGLDVQEFTAFHFRVAGHIDLYPKRRRFHNIRTQDRGYYPQDVIAFVKDQIAKTEGQSKSKHVSAERMQQAGWWTKHSG